MTRRQGQAWQMGGRLSHPAGLRLAASYPGCQGREKDLRGQLSPQLRHGRLPPTHKYGHKLARESFGVGRLGGGPFSDLEL